MRLFETQFELKKGERFCRNISIINDRTIEGREFFIVFLEDLRWGEIIQLLPIVIEDDDCKKIDVEYNTAWLCNACTLVFTRGMYGYILLC